MKRKLTAVSLFSGCGGFDWGAKQAGVDIIWANDIDPHALPLIILIPDVNVLRDVRTSRFPSRHLIGCIRLYRFQPGARRRCVTTRARYCSDGTFISGIFTVLVKVPQISLCRECRGMVRQ